MEHKQSPFSFWLNRQLPMSPIQNGLYSNSYSTGEKVSHFVHQAVSRCLNQKEQYQGANHMIELFTYHDRAQLDYAFQTTRLANRPEFGQESLR